MDALTCGSGKRSGIEGVYGTICTKREKAKKAGLETRNRVRGSGQQDAVVLVVITPLPVPSARHSLLSRNQYNDNDEG